MSGWISHLFVWLAWLIAFGPLLWLLVFLLSLPMLRQERARFFLDLLETGWKEGRSAENTIVAISQSQDRAMGVRFHLLAAYLEMGLPFGQALEKVPYFLSPQIKAMLKVGEEIGDPRRVLPACRQLLKDGLSKTRGAFNFAMILPLVLLPVAPLIFLMLLVFVYPKFLQIFSDMEVPVPALTLLVISQAHLCVWVTIAAAVLVLLAAFFYVGGPRVLAWGHGVLQPVSDWMALRIPWRYKRLQRDFSAMLAILLDATVPEERALKLAAESTANGIFLNRAKRAVEDLRAGRKLPEAMRRLDDSGEFHWRLSNACHTQNRFLTALSGWLESLDAKAFQQEQAAAHVITTALVLVNGLFVGLLTAGTFQALISVIETGVLW
ncbi:MAG: type II secretion system F family protein [Verrucomicrobiota bacterium]